MVSCRTSRLRTLRLCLHKRSSVPVFVGTTLEYVSVIFGTHTGVSTTDIVYRMCLNALRQRHTLSQSEPISDLEIEYAQLLFGTAQIAQHTAHSTQCGFPVSRSVIPTRTTLSVRNMFNFINYRCCAIATTSGIFSNSNT